MNRCVAAFLPGSEGLAVASVMPLILRGASRAETWSPPLANHFDPVLLQRLQTLYAADPALARDFEQTLRQARGELIGGDGKRNGHFPQLMAAAARLMSANGGPRIGFVEDNGWDTHGNQVGILDRKLAELDAGLRAWHDGAPGLWAAHGDRDRHRVWPHRRRQRHGRNRSWHRCDDVPRRRRGEWRAGGRRMAGPETRRAQRKSRCARQRGPAQRVSRDSVPSPGLDGRALDQQVFPGSACLPDVAGAALLRAPIVHVG